MSLARRARRPEPRRRVPSIAVPPIYQPASIQNIELGTDRITLTLSGPVQINPDVPLRARVWVQVIPSPPEPGLVATGIQQQDATTVVLLFSGNPAINFWALQWFPGDQSMRTPGGGFVGEGFFRPD